MQERSRWYIFTVKTATPDCTQVRPCHSYGVLVWPDTGAQRERIHRGPWDELEAGRIRAERREGRGRAGSGGGGATGEKLPALPTGGQEWAGGCLVWVDGFSPWPGSYSDLLKGEPHWRSAKGPVSRNGMILFILFIFIYYTYTAAFYSILHPVCWKISLNQSKAQSAGAASAHKGVN